MNKTKYQIKKLGEDFVEKYDNLKDAAASVDTKMDNWKVQMLIADAIINKKRAFKCKWQKV